MASKGGGFTEIPANEGGLSQPTASSPAQQHLAASQPTTERTPLISRSGVDRTLENARALVRRHPYYVYGGVAVVILLLILLLFNAHPSNHNAPSHGPAFVAPSLVGISHKTLLYGLSKCDAIRSQKNRPDISSSSKRTRNPRAVPGTPPVVITNAIVWDGIDGIHANVSVVLDNGIITQLDSDVALPEGAHILDAKHHIVTAGLVDMHSHIGVFSWPNLYATLDVNEFSGPITPYVRVIDAFNPSDSAIRIVASGGVTTGLVLPGSANLIGGEAYAFKYRPVPTLSNKDMLVQAGLNDEDEAPWRWMKMACGENPKRVYASRGGPTTRLGEGFLFRHAFEQAHTLLQQQNDWCDAAAEAHRDNRRLQSRFPEDLKLESLVALLRGDFKVNVHCYETMDIEAMIRHSEEFGFEIAAFHHALDAYRIPAIIKRAPNNITIATFADHWGYKKEAYQASVKSPKILAEAGIPVAIKSDHPVLNSQHLIFEAAKAHYYGLPSNLALASVTSTPAHAMGLGHRIGRIAPGYDADVVIWDRNPFELGASPLQVYIDGVPLLDDPKIKLAEVRYSNLDDMISHSNRADKISITSTINNLQSNTTTNSFVLRNIGKIYLDSTTIIEASSLSGELAIAVESGRIICAGHCEPAELTRLSRTADSYDLQGANILPGLIAVGTALGLIEIELEPLTGDGYYPGGGLDPSSLVRAIDGLKFGTRHLEEAYKGGVLTSVTAPLGSGTIGGLSVAFRTGANSILDDETIIKPIVALHFRLGLDMNMFNDLASSSTQTISSQIALLRRILAPPRNAANISTQSSFPSDPYSLAAHGQLPILIHTDNKDEIASLIQLHSELHRVPKFVILGGAESYLLAEQLAKAKIPVIVNPALCTPDQFSAQHCLVGAPLTNGTAVHILHNAGVLVGVGLTDASLARNLAWDAGWFAATSNGNEFSDKDAIALVTWNLEKILGLEGRRGLKVGEKAEFIVYRGNISKMGGRVEMVVGGKGLGEVEILTGNGDE